MDLFDFIPDDDWHMDILIIGVGSDGCAAIETDPTKELLTKKKHTHIYYVGIATEIQSLEKCTAEQKILIPKSSLSVPSEISSFIKHLPTPDMAFVITGAKHEDDSALSAALIQQLKKNVHSVMAMVILPEDDEQYYNDFLEDVISCANTTHMLYPKNIYMAMVKIFQCIIDTICVEGLICLDFSDVSTIFGSKGTIHKCEYLGLLTYMGYGVAYGDEKSQRAEQAAKQALQSITLPAWRTLKDTCTAFYSIKANSEITGEEINTICEIIGEAVAEDANIIFSVLFVDGVESLEVQLITVFD